MLSGSDFHLILVLNVAEKNLSNMITLWEHKSWEIFEAEAHG